MKHGDRVRHRQTGDLGIVLEREGKLRVSYARAGAPPEVVYDPNIWAADEQEIRELNPGQRARVAFDADQAMCYITGQYSKRVRMGFDGLPDEERIRWGDPKRPPMPEADRQWLYLCVHRGLMAPKKRADG